MNREPETDPNWEFLNGCDERELVDEVKLRQAEVERLRADLENAQRLARIQADELTASEERCQRVTESRDSFLKENGRLKKELLSLSAENAELRESLQRIVGHLEYEAKQGDGIAADAWDDYFAAKWLLGHKGMPNAAARGLASIRLEIATTKPGAGT